MSRRLRKAWVSLTLSSVLYFMGLSCVASEYFFDVVPQQPPVKLFVHWQPIFNEIETQIGISLMFRTAPSIPEFERRMLSKDYDFAYMNRHYYTVASSLSGRPLFPVL